MACAKHYVGDGGTTRGINENNTLASKPDLLSIHMPPYYNAVNKGVGSIMISYSSWNGVKMHSNRDLITGFLKNTLHFKVRKSASSTLYTRCIPFDELNQNHRSFRCRDSSSQTGRESIESLLHLISIIHIQS